MIQVNKISARTGSDGKPDCEYFVFTSPTTPSTIARRTKRVSFSQSTSSHLSANNSLHLKPVLRATTTMARYGSMGRAAISVWISLAARIRGSTCLRLMPLTLTNDRGLVPGLLLFELREGDLPGSVMLRPAMSHETARFTSNGTLRYCVTVKTPELAAIPPGVVIAIFPVFAPVGTSAITFLSESTVTLVAGTPPNVTFVV